MTEMEAEMEASLKQQQAKRRAAASKRASSNKRQKQVTPGFILVTYSRAECNCLHATRESANDSFRFQMFGLNCLILFVTM